MQLAEPVQYAVLDSLYLPVEDSEPLPLDLLEKGMAFVQVERQQEKAILIACGAGISRSVTFAVAALKQVEGYALLDALRLIVQHHSESMPHPALWTSLTDYYQEDVSLQDMLNILMERNQ